MIRVLLEIDYLFKFNNQKQNQEKHKQHPKQLNTQNRFKVHTTTANTKLKKLFTIQQNLNFKKNKAQNIKTLKHHNSINKK